MDVLYKPLAEILLLHEFYLTDSELNNIFTLPDQAARLAWLTNNYDESEPTINNDLLACPDEATKITLRNQHMRLIVTNSGFMIAVRVLARTLADGSQVYQPKIPIPANLSLNILLLKKNAALDSFTGSRITRNIPSIYFFSNDDVAGPKTSPFLANAVSAYDENYIYEMGELAIKDGTLQQFTSDGAPQPWAAVDSEGFANENDRLLLSPTFDYTFLSGDLVTQASFTLVDAAGKTVQTLQAQGSPLTRASLDFSASQPATLGDKQAFPLYTLQVTGDNGYARSYPILFYPNVAPLRQAWGLITIRTTTRAAAFDLVQPDGFLTARAPAGQPAIPTPVFELRIKSRLAFWRYNNSNAGVALSTNKGTTNYLTASNGLLVSIHPRICTYVPTLFLTGTETDNLPNPKYGSLLNRNGGRFYKDIWVLRTELFSPDPP